MSNFHRSSLQNYGEKVVMKITAGETSLSDDAKLRC